MIPPICLLEYKKYRSLDLKVTRFINDQILKMLTVIQETSEADKDEDVYGVVPRGCFRDENFSFEKKIEEIRAILASEIIRENNLEMSLVNKYIIFQVIDTYIQFDFGDDVLSEIPDQLKKEILDCPEYWDEAGLEGNGKPYNVVLYNICNYKEYLEFLFDDWDFMGETPSYVMNWTMNMEETDLDQLKSVEEFLPMVPDDIYEKYKKECRRYSKMENEDKQATGNIIVTGSQNIVVGNGSVNNGNNTDRPNKSDENCWKKYGLPTIIAACIGLLGTVLTIVFAN